MYHCYKVFPVRSSEAEDLSLKKQAKSNSNINIVTEKYVDIFRNRFAVHLTCIYVQRKISGTYIHSTHHLLEKAKKYKAYPIKKQYKSNGAGNKVLKHKIQNTRRNKMK